MFVFLCRADAISLALEKYVGGDRLKEVNKNSGQIFQLTGNIFGYIRLATTCWYSKRVAIFAGRVDIQNVNLQPEYILKMI
jgi:hypothetical protein